MLLIGDVREKLKELDECSVQCCVTSPPYWGLRDYGTAEWEGGDESCSHKRESKKSDKTITGHKNFEEMNGVGDAIYKSVCKRCGAKRKDRQLGLEETPEEYVENMVEVFREVKRVLKDDGTVWLNLGDSYIGGGRGYDYCKDGTVQMAHIKAGVKYGKPTGKIKGLKSKDLCGIPWRVAFALQSDGWYLRQDIIWHKPNPMPESVRDRCTKSHEYIFLLTKSAKYYYDQESIREPLAERSIGRLDQIIEDQEGSSRGHGGAKPNGNMKAVGDVKKGRNKRSVWTITTKPYKEAHFAVFPKDIPTYCIKAGTKEGDVVLDPFMGSGTTALVAQEFGRKWVGVELNPEYAEIIKTRTAQTTIWG